MDFLTQFLYKDYFVLFLIIALGIALGKISIKGIKFDLSAVIFVALFFGWLFNYYHIAVTIPPIIQKTGLVLFIYTIGMQAGPSFFSSFKEQGLRFMAVAAIIVVVGGIMAWGISFFWGIDLKLMTGLLTGALTSTPGLAAAIEASKSPMASIGYGIAYPFGVLGVILFVKLSPKIFSKDIKEAETEFKAHNLSDKPSITNRTFVVTNENVDSKTLGELKIRFMTKANISRIMRNDGSLVVPGPEEKLFLEDRVKAVGTEDALHRVELLLGNPTDEVIPQSGNLEIRWFVVSNEQVVNKSLAELNIMGNYHATITRIRRSGIDLTPHPSTKLRYGDRVLISLYKGNMSQVTQLLGDSLKQISETSFLPVAVGIVLGIVLGAISIPLGRLHFQLGLTGGVLMASLFFSWKGKTGPLIWNLSGPSSQLLRQMGLLLFLAPVGIEAGAHLTAALSQYGVSLFLFGALITLVPMILACIVGVYVFKLNFLSLLGALTGGMTSTPGLSVVDSMTETEAPQLAYAAVYPLSLVLVIIAAEVLALV